MSLKYFFFKGENGVFISIIIPSLKSLQIYKNFYWKDDIWRIWRNLGTNSERIRNSIYWLKTCAYKIKIPPPSPLKWSIKTMGGGGHNQGINARKVISEVYAFFVLLCTVFGRKSKHKTDVTAWHGINFRKNNLMKYSGHRKLLCGFSKF